VYFGEDIMMAFSDVVLVLKLLVDSYSVLEDPIQVTP
jgi:hypothetical protein